MTLNLQFPEKSIKITMSLLEFEKLYCLTHHSIIENNKGYRRSDCKSKFCFGMNPCDDPHIIKRYGRQITVKLSNDEYRLFIDRIL